MRQGFKFSSKKILVVLFSLGFILSCCAQHRNLRNYQVPLSKVIDSMDISLNDLEIHIDKSDYTLSIMADTMILKQYPVVFGSDPIDDKMYEGDGCTPEGVFKMKMKYPHNKWSKFIWIDYPNNNSWKKFNQAKKDGKIPADAKIGGSIGIHGVPKNCDYAIDAKMNWTRGCISLKNKDINEIYEIVGLNTLIYIQK
jgi:murein L,D-transpeptidase YafK